MSKINNETKLKLIQLYRKNECLWKISDIDYLSTSLKNHVLKNIAEELQMTRDALQNEIRILRKSYLNQKLKIKISMKTRSKANLNKPIWWLYDEMRFLDENIYSGKDPYITDDEDDEWVNDDININLDPNNQTTNLDDFDDSSSSSNESMGEKNATNTAAYKVNNATSLPTFQTISSKSTQLQLEDKYKLESELNNYKHHIFNDKIRQSNQSLYSSNLETSQRQTLTSHSRNLSYIDMSRYLTRDKSPATYTPTQYNRYNFQPQLNHHYINTKPCTVTSGTYTKTNIPIMKNPVTSNLRQHNRFDYQSSTYYNYLKSKPCTVTSGSSTNTNIPKKFKYPIPKLIITPPSPIKESTLPCSNNTNTIINKNTNPKNTITPPGSFLSPFNNCSVI